MVTKKNNHISLLNHCNIKKAIVLLAMPNVIAMITTAIYGFIDVIFVGRLNNTLAITALSISAPIILIIIAVSQTIAIGSASYISRSIGEGRKDLANRTASTAVFLGIIVSILITILGLIFLKQILNMMGASVEVLPYALSYSKWLILGSTFLIINGILNGLLRAEGNARYSMLIVVIASVANIILDPIFIFVLNMGVAGASIATLIAQGIATIYLMLYYLTGKSDLKVGIKCLRYKNKEDKKIYFQIFKIGTPVFIMQVLSSIGMTLLNGKAIVYGGDSMVAAMGIVNKIHMIPLYIFTGFTQGLQPFISYNYGAKKYWKLQKSINYTVKLLLIVSIAFVFILQLIPDIFINLFTSNQLVYKLGRDYLKITSYLLPIVALTLLYNSLFQALGKAKESLILSIGKQLVIFIPSIYIFPQLFTQSGKFISWFKLVLPYEINDGLYGIMYIKSFADLITFILTIFLAISLYKNLEELKLSNECCDKQKGHER